MIIPSATVLLIRDGADALEVFMVKRHRNIAFAGGALVFPGGKLDEADSNPEIRNYCTVSDDVTDPQLAMRMGGIRETFEESGVLLARDAGNDDFLSGERSAQLQPYRDRLNNGEVTMMEMATQENLLFACDLMTPYAHWITPPDFHKRFDTWFYIVRTPSEQLASHDEGESTDSLWINPDQAVTDALEKRRFIVFATRANLLRLAMFKDCESALEASRNYDYPVVSPNIETQEDGSIFRIPKDIGYPTTEMFMPGELR